MSESADALPATPGARGTVGLILLRSYLLAGDTGHYDGVIDALEARGAQLQAGLEAAAHAAGLPTAKTGAAIRKQAPVVVENILELMAHQKLSDERYEGYSSCPLVTGYGSMVLAEFKYDNVRDSDPLISTFVDTTQEQYSMWLLKKYGLPYLYWNHMLRGRL